MLYGLLYAGSFAVHFMLMQYVLGGCAYLVIDPPENEDYDTVSPSSVLRDWLPFVLGVTITAGVAPLLFIQLIYQDAYYSANLLLFNRWMALLPAMIIAFYGLYVIKSQRFLRWDTPNQRAFLAVVLGCMVYVAYSWTENHLLSMATQSEWTQFYKDGNWLYAPARVLPRVLAWICMALATVALLLSVQLRVYHQLGIQVRASTQLISIVARFGLCGAIPLVGILTLSSVPFVSWASACALLLTVCLGWQFLTWRQYADRADVYELPLRLLCTQWLLMCLLVVCLRYAIRSAVQDASSVVESFDWFGMVLFFLFAALNTTIIVALIRRVKSELHPQV